MPTVSWDNLDICQRCVLGISAKLAEDGDEDEDGDVINNELPARLVPLQNQRSVMENARRRTLKR